ncbi:alanine:cation symporter family protein [Anaerococcus sp. Marseille-Q5996]|uniref:alanine:cation symporter family protein n=1 Tax=Anaerococcus sp. Marseille-Q5996 TaxID=2972769 RepID=UPI0021C7EA02|nr:alanine:cation symporter family protein [Anaerococcus sp. Marseille-Q5996]
MENIISIANWMWGNVIASILLAVGGQVGRWLVFFAISLFGFTTLIVDLFYGESNIPLILGKNYKWTLIIYRIIAFIMFLFARQMDLSNIWGFIDVFVGIVVFINLICLFLSYKDVN